MNLYYARLAPNPDRVRYFLQEKGLWETFPKTEISIMKGEHRAPEYRRLSPLSQVPVLELDDGTAITESRAICTLIEGLHPDPNLMGADPVEKARIEMWDRRVELGYLVLIAGWFRNSHPAMAELEKPQSAEWAAISEGRARKAVKFFDTRLSESPYLAGDRFTIADITLHVAMGFGKIVKFKPWEEHANLAAWRERVSVRPGLAL
ncbi:MAG: glutathione S-transferase [Hyphomonadaceae bacterium]